MNDPFNYNGVRVVEDVTMVTIEETRTKRTWAERLFGGAFTAKWDPRRVYDVATKQVPSKHLMYLGDMIVGHPTAIKLFKAHFDEIDKTSA